MANHTLDTIESTNAEKLEPEQIRIYQSLPNVARVEIAPRSVDMHYAGDYILHHHDGSAATGTARGRTLVEAFTYVMAKEITIRFTTEQGSDNTEYKKMFKQGYAKYILYGLIANNDWTKYVRWWLLVADIVRYLVNFGYVIPSKPILCAHKGSFVTIKVQSMIDINPDVVLARFPTRDSNGNLY